MSMLSAKCDRLRERAEDMRFLAPDPDVPYLVPSTKETMALAMRSAASEMEDAADTIWQLRNTNLDTANENDKLKAENEELRERVAELEELTDGKRYIPQEWYAQLKAEDDRLRKLLQDVAICASGNYCYDCPHQHDGCDRDERLRAERIEVPE